MNEIDEYVNALYRSDDYISKNPSLHEKDSPWKVTTIVPLLDTFLRHWDGSQMNLLDVGGVRA